MLLSPHSGSQVVRPEKDMSSNSVSMPDEDLYESLSAPLAVNSTAEEQSTTGSPFMVPVPSGKPSHQRPEKGSATPLGISGTPSRGNSIASGAGARMMMARQLNSKPKRNFLDNFAIART